MPVVLRSLSDFKRFLREPGATIQIVRNTHVERQPEAMQEAYRRRGLYEPRTVRALSRRAAVFAVRGHDATIWLYWDKGTRRWRFSGDTVAVPLKAALGAPDEIVYRCTLPEDGAARTAPKPDSRKPDSRKPVSRPRRPAAPTAPELPLPAQPASVACGAAGAA